MPAATVIQMRRGTAATWTSANPTLHAGEAGFETDTGKLKVGDGTTAWTGLPYIGGGGSGTVTTTGSPASGNLTKFSGSTSITSGDLSGDVTTSGTLATTIASNAVTTGKIAAANVTLAKVANASANSVLLGSGASGSGASYSELALGTGLSMTGTTLNVSGTSPGIDPRSAIYPPFTPAGIDDEFTGTSLSGSWTLVNDGTHLATNTVKNDTLSILLPGSDTSAHLQAYLQATTVSTNDIIEMAFNGNGTPANFHMAGLIFADGNTFGSGKQICMAVVPSQNNIQTFAQTGFNSQGGDTLVNVPYPTTATLFFRLKFTGSNTYTTYVSSDAISWAQVSSGLAGPSGMGTPTNMGFFATTWGASSQFVWSIRYFRKTI